MTKFPKLTAAAAVLVILAGFGVGNAQVFDTPASDFRLESVPDGISIATTLDIGNFDPAVTIPGAQVLNEVAITGGSVFTSDTELVHRIWTITHDSASDTRSLVQTTPSDIIVTSPDDPFYGFPSTLTLLDLTGDGNDDISLLGIDEGFTMGGSAPADVLGIQSQAGPTFFQTSIELLGAQNEGSISGSELGFQPALAHGDFDGDGLLDLAIYDFNSGNGDQLAVTLANNGSVGLLPRLETVVTVPAPFAGLDAAIFIIAADIDGDGPTDIAIVYGDLDEIVESFLLAYRGNGDGTFVPDPMANVSLGAEGVPQGLAVGNYDGDDFLDFSVLQIDVEAAQGDLQTVLCNPGDPAACSVASVTLQGPRPNNIATSIDSADFDGDGLDDVVASIVLFDSEAENGVPEGGAQLRLNQGDGSFTGDAQQFIPLGGTPEKKVTLQVVAKDIDGCGGPDIALTGLEIPTPEPDPTDIALPTGELGEVPTSHATVAFNHAEDPVADAGTPVSTSGGLRVGGDPTCSGEPGETLLVQWEVVSGDADISDPAAANPIVNADSQSVLQVTCTSLCGASSSATVTVSGNFLLSGTGCALSPAATGGMAWLLGLAALLPWSFLRRKR